MKKVLIFALSAFLLIGSGVAIGSSFNGSFNGNPIVKVTYQGKELITEDIPAMIYDDRTMVPLYLLKQLGYELTWNQDTYSVDIKQTSQTANRRKLSGQEIAKLADSVGLITVYDSSGMAYGQGSGFIINKEGLLISAHHVRAGSSKLVYDNRGRSSFNTVDFDNEKSDVIGITLGKLPENIGKTFKYLSYTTKLPEIGDKVYAIGYPRGSFSITDGLVSAIEDVNGIKKIKHTALTDHGGSGGVLLNEYGEAVGITVSKGDSKLENYAIPMLYVQQELKIK